jgi:hypothetical protein
MVTLVKLENNVVPYNAKTIEYVNYKTNTKEFTALEEILGSTAQARLLCHLEKLHKTLKRPSEVFTQNIHSLNAKGDEDGLIGYMKCSKRSLLYYLSDIRTHYTFESGVKLSPETIDFQGKYYASYFLPKKGAKTLFWYRSRDNLARLLQDVKEHVSNNHWVNT